MTFLLAWEKVLVSSSACRDKIRHSAEGKREHCVVLQASHFLEEHQMVCPSRKISKLAVPCLFDLNRAKRKTVHPDGRHLLILLWSLLPFGLFLEKRMCYFEQTDSFCLWTWLVDLVESWSLPFWCETEMPLSTSADEQRK